MLQPESFASVQFVAHYDGNLLEKKHFYRASALRDIVISKVNLILCSLKWLQS